MKLIITEKPSAGQSIGKVPGTSKRCDGYLEKSGYVVSWCIGHLVELAEPQSYDAKYEKWNRGDLPSCRSTGYTGDLRQRRSSSVS